MISLCLNCLRITIKTAFLLNKIPEFAKGLISLFCCLLISPSPRKQYGITGIRNNKPRKNPVLIIKVLCLLNLTAIEKKKNQLQPENTYHPSKEVNTCYQHFKCFYCNNNPKPF